MPTKFALDELDMKTSDGYRFVFYFDGNGKITRENSPFNSPISNAFSLAQVQTAHSLRLYVKAFVMFINWKRQRRKSTRLTNKTAL